MANLIISVGVMMLPIGFILGATKAIPTFWVYVIGLIGFTCLLWAMWKVKKEDERREDRHKELIEAIRSINKIKGDR